MSKTSLICPFSCEGYGCKCGGGLAWLVWLVALHAPDLWARTIQCFVHKMVSATLLASLFRGLYMNIVPSVSLLGQQLCPGSSLGGTTRLVQGGFCWEVFPFHELGQVCQPRSILSACLEVVICRATRFDRKWRDVRLRKKLYSLTIDYWGRQLNGVAQSLNEMPRKASK